VFVIIYSTFWKEIYKFLHICKCYDETSIVLFFGLTVYNLIYSGDYQAMHEWWYRMQTICVLHVQ